MYCTIVEFGTPAFDELVVLRDAVLRKPLGLEFKIEDLATEYDSMHLACYSDHYQLWGCLVLKPLGDGVVKMRQVATTPEMQGKGVGSLLVAYSETIARAQGYQMMELSARLPAVHFYEKQDYISIGPIYTEVGIDHQKMHKRL